MINMTISAGLISMLAMASQLVASTANQQLQFLTQATQTKKCGSLITSPLELKTANKLKVTYWRQGAGMG